MYLGFFVKIDLPKEPGELSLEQQHERAGKGSIKNIFMISQFYNILNWAETCKKQLLVQPFREKKKD